MSSASTVDLIHGWWSTHARGEFPRHLWEGRGPWVVMQSEDTWIPSLEAARGRGSEAHTTVNPGMDSDAPYITKILLETDEPSVDENYRIARAVVRLLMVDHGAVPRVYFSGGKSFHVYADFEPFRSRDPGAVAVEWARRFAREVGEAVGRPVEFDLEVVRALHMSRLPFFPRADLKGTPIPVDIMSMPLDAIRKLSYSWEVEPRPDALPRPEVRPSAGMLLALLRVWEEVGDPEEVAGPPEAGEQEPPRGGRIGWIEAVLRTPFEDGRKRLVALVLGPYLRRVRGMGEAEAARALMEWLQMSGATDSE
ncbi:MAG: hypothetical protein ACP5RJ_08375, partial [Conexivisphaera sp.]